MGVLRLVVTGFTEKKKPWWQQIGTAANNAVGEAALERLVKNYPKGTFLQLQEKVNKKNTTHMTLEASGDEDKHKDFSACELWSKLESDQINDKDIRGTDFDTTWNKTLSFTNFLDAQTALSGVADVTPKNTILVLGSIDDNGGWHVEKEMKGKASVSAGAVNADEAEEIPAKGNGKGKHKLEVV